MMRHVPENRLAAGLTFFVTCTLKDRQPLFSHPHKAQAVVDALQFYRAQRILELFGFVVMPDHVHMIAKLSSSLTRPSFMNRFKSYVAHCVSVEAIWQRGYWSEVVASEAFLRQKLTYLHENPVRAGLSTKEEDFLWSSARDTLSDNPRLTDPIRGNPT